MSSSRPVSGGRRRGGRYPAARAALLDDDIDFGETRLLTEITGIPAVRVTNIKRRFARLGEKIKKELRPSNEGGGAR